MSDIHSELAEYKAIATDVLKMAKSLGVDAAEVAVNRTSGIAVTTRLGEVETVEFNADGALGIAVYRGNRKGSASTADLSPNALKRAVEAASDIARFTSEDPCAGIADKEFLAFEPPELDLYHASNWLAEDAIAIAKRCEASALEHDNRITNSDGATVNSHQGLRVYANSHDLVIGYPSSRHNISCVSIATENGDMQRDYHYSVARNIDNLESPEFIGIEAANNTIARLNGQKLSTRKVPIMFRADVASSLFGHFISAISGGNLYRESSFLLDSLGTQVLPEFINIVERPHLLGGLASSPFDSEGVRTVERNIVEQGNLQTYLLTSYSARKLGMVTTGHAGGIHNWMISHHGKSLEQMLATLHTGFLVTELMGQGVNMVTGDYSRGASGFWVENGKIAYPVREVTIAGNLKDMLKSIVEVGGDIDHRGAIHSGSVLLAEMQIAGN